MRAVGWPPRAAGWFTMQITAGFLGVVALGSASRYSGPGTAEITLHVSIRDEAVEAVVSQLCGEGYRQRTASGGIGTCCPAAPGASGVLRRTTRRSLRASSQRLSRATQSPTCTSCCPITPN